MLQAKMSQISLEMLSSIKTGDGRSLLRASIVDRSFIKPGILVYLPAGAFRYVKTSSTGVDCTQTGAPAYGIVVSTKSSIFADTTLMVDVAVGEETFSCYLADLYVSIG